MMVADLTDKGRLRKEAFKNMHLVSASECRILYYSKSCDNSVSDSIKEFVKDQSWVNGTIFSDSLEFPDGMELYRTLLIGDQNERRVRFVKQNTEATTKVIVKQFFPGRNLSSSNIAKNQMDLLQSMAGDYFDFVILKNELPDGIFQTLRTYGSKAPLQLLASCNALPLMMEPCSQNDPFKPDNSGQAGKPGKRGKAAAKRKADKITGTAEDGDTDDSRVVNEETGLTEKEWTAIKQKNKWEPNAEYFPGREQPKTDGTMRSSRGGRKTGSKMGPGGQLQTPAGNKLAMMEAKPITGLKNDPAAARDQMALEQQLRECIKQRDEVIEALEEQVAAKQQAYDALLEQFNSLNADFQLAKEYSSGREKLHNLAHSGAHRELMIMNAMAQKACPEVSWPEPVLPGKDIEEYAWKWDTGY